MKLETNISKGKKKKDQDILKSEKAIKIKSKTIIFNQEMTDNSITQLIGKIDGILVDTKHDVIIYFTSDGGDSGYDIITDYINTNADRITVIATWGVHSTAAIMLMHIKCKIKILDDAFALLHLASQSIDYKSTYKIKEPMGVYLLKDVEEANKKILKDYISFYKLSDEETLKIENGNDVIIDNGRLKAIFNKPILYNTGF